jgi:aminopeptidase N
MYGAMENTTATVYGDFYLIDERSYLDRPYVGTNAHELAHQWFGDLVTARSLTHHWLQESFATYYNGMYEEKVFGKDYYSWARRGAVNAALEASKTDKFPIAYSNAGTTRHYPKGAHVLHMLKYVLGREEYNKGIKYYLTQHKYKNVDSEDLLIAFHDALGVSLDWFWEEWVYKGGEPAYNVSYKTVTDNGALSTMVSVDQTHTRSDIVGLFKMPFVFEVYYTDGTKDSVRTTIEKEHHDVIIPNKGGKKIAFVLFDPNSNVMKQVTFTKSTNEYMAQAAGAPNMIDRYDALVGLRATPMDQKRDFLIDRFSKETFHAPKTEIISQLANDNNPASVDLMKKALADKDDDVRKAAVTNLTTISNDLLPEVEKLLKDPSYDLVAMVLEKLAFNFPANVDRYLDMTKGTVGVRGHNVEIKWLEVAIGAGKKEHTDKLVDYCSNSYEFLTRVNALNALKKLDVFPSKALSYALDAAVSPNTRLSGPAIGVLKYFYDQAAYRKSMLDYYRAKTWKGYERDLLKPIFGE